jgi:prophage regulatory protein
MSDVAETGATDSTVQRMLNEAQVLALVPFSRTSLWRAEKAGRFPKSTYISPNRHAWFESDIVDWQNSVKGRGRTQQIQPKKNKAKRAKQLNNTRLPPDQQLHRLSNT